MSTEFSGAPSARQESYFFLARLSSGQVSLRVNEAAALIRFQPQDKVLTSTVELPVDKLRLRDVPCPREP